jgi:hypothetical protein
MVAVLPPREAVVLWCVGMSSSTAVCLPVQGAGQLDVVPYRPLSNTLGSKIIKQGDECHEGIGQRGRNNRMHKHDGTSAKEWRPRRWLLKRVRGG